MKLGLLVVAVVAVVVLGPSPSESRIVSKCELKERLDEAITVSKKLQRIKPKLLAVVICEAARRSHLNTELVRVFGKRIPTTTATPTTTTATTTRPQMAHNNNNTTTTTRRPTTTTTSTTTRTTAPTTTTTTTTRRPTTTTTATTTRTTAPTTTELILGINRTTAGSRRKRDAEEENMDELLNEEEGQFDEEELENDDNGVNDDDESEESEQVTEDDEHRHKRSLAKKSKKSFRGRPWSLGLYGIFQLKDSHFCYSGYRWSRNVCQSDCNAFTDDDITDDIDCLVKSNYWLYILSSSSRWCRRHARTFLNECH